MIRVIIPDVHGYMADPAAVKACIEDVRMLEPREVVILGDFTDVGGVFSGHPANYTEELAHSYDEDLQAGNAILDRLIKAAPKAAFHFLEGNHEHHVERWAARQFKHHKDAEHAREKMAPEQGLQLEDRGIRYYRRSESHMGLAVPGVIKLGRCLFTHGIRAGKHATSAHLDDFCTNVVHGHTHRAQAVVRRTVASGEIGAWCPGTLAKLQPLYLHTQVSAWSHGYALQFVERDGRFLHLQVPIAGGRSMLKPLLQELRPRKLSS